MILSEQEAKKILEALQIANESMDSTGISAWHQSRVKVIQAIALISSKEK